VEVGEVHETTPPEVAFTAVGAPGVVAGVTALEASEATLVPARLLATTVKV
jgi:hypothetical protein